MTPYRTPAIRPPPQSWRVTSWQKRAVRFHRWHHRHSFNMAIYICAAPFAALLGCMLSDCLHPNNPLEVEYATETARLIGCRDTGKLVMQRTHDKEKAWAAYSNCAGVR